MTDTCPHVVTEGTTSHCSLAHRQIEDMTRELAVQRHTIDQLRHMTDDDILEHQLDMEGRLHQRLNLAVRMLARIQRGWEVRSIDGEDGEWWVHLNDTRVGSHFDRPDMALNDDEIALWEAIRNDPGDHQ
jgi:hypothetical protein